MDVSALPRSQVPVQPIAQEQVDWAWSFVSELTAWREWLAVRGRAKDTVDSYESSLMWFFLRASRQAGYAVLPRTATQREIVHYLSTISPQGHAPGQLIRSLRSYYKWARKEGLVGFDPTEDIPFPRPRFSPAPTLGIEDIYKLFLVAWDRHPRRAWAILLMYTTGGRLKSMCSLTEADMTGGWCYFSEAKGGRSYRVPLSSAAEVAVEGLKNTPPPRKQNKNSEWRDKLIGVGPGMLWVWVTQAGEDSGIKVWPHLIRHSFATEHRKIHPRTWQALMGHADLGQYARYAHVDEAEMRAALEEQGRGD